MISESNSSDIEWFVCRQMNGNKKCNKKYKTKTRYEQHLDKSHNPQHPPQPKKLKTDNLDVNYSSNVNIVGTNSNIPREESELTSTLTKLKKHVEDQDKLIISLNSKVDGVFKDNVFLRNEVTALKKEYTKFKHEHILSTTGYCQVCWDNEANYAFMGCGHACSCGTCAALVLSTHRKCPICRSDVYDIMQIWNVGRKEDL